MSPEREQVLTFGLRDEDTNGEAAVIVTVFGRKVGLCLTAMKGADVELWLNREQTRMLVEGLTEALSRVASDRREGAVAAGTAAT
jgi:hypothetical protein